MKKILVSMMTIAMVSALIGGGIYAAFSDPETGTGTAFQAGTIDLQVDADGLGYDAIWTDTLTLQDMEPDDTADLKFRNYGTLDGVMDITMGTFTGSDAALATDADFEFNDASGYTMDGDEYAKLVYVTLSGGDSWVSDPDGMASGNGDTKVSLYEIANATTTAQINLTGSGGANNEVTLTFKLGHTFDDDVGDPYTGHMSAYPGGADWDISPETDTLWNDPQADGLTCTITATLNPS